MFFRLSTAGGENFSTFWVCFCVFTTKNNVFLKDFTAKSLKNFPPPAVILEFLPPLFQIVHPQGGVKTQGGKSSRISVDAIFSFFPDFFSNRNPVLRGGGAPPIDTFLFFHYSYSRMKCGPGNNEFSCEGISDIELHMHPAVEIKLPQGL